MKRFIRVVALCMAIVTTFAFPASADDFDNVSYIELLDYTTLLNGLNSLVVPTHKSVVVHVPQYEVYTYYELIYRGPSGVTLLIDNQKLTTVSIGNGLFRAYGNATTAGNFVLGLEYSGTSPVSINFYSIRASNISREHYLEIASCYYEGMSYAQTSPSSYVSFRTQYDTDNRVIITCPYWKKYDYIDYCFTFVDDEAGLTSVSAEYNGIALPITVTPWEMPDRVEDDVNAAYFSPSSYSVVVRVDVRGLDRTLVANPELHVQVGVGDFYFYSCTGYIVTNTISPFTYWFNRINSAFATLQQRQDAMHQDQLQFYLDNIDALSSLHDDLITAIDAVDDTISSFWAEVSNRLAQFQISMENQIHGFRVSVENWFSTLSGKLDQILHTDTSNSEQFEDDIASQATEMEDISETLDSVTKPPVEDLDPSVDDIVSPEDIENYTSILGIILGNNIFLSICLMSLTLALVSYTLYGKR